MQNIGGKSAHMNTSNQVGKLQNWHLERAGDAKKPKKTRANKEFPLCPINFIHEINVSGSKCGWSSTLCLEVGIISQTHRIK